MSGVNKVTLVGNLGADPELRHTTAGTSVANFRVATSEHCTRDGESHQRTEWHRIVCWGNLAQNCAKYLAKGRQVLIEGRLQTRSYERDGVKRFTTEIVATNVQFLGTSKAKSEPATSPDEADLPSDMLSDDDVPF